MYEEDLLVLIVYKSNRYALQNGITVNLSVKDLEAFIGMLIIMGFNLIIKFKTVFVKG